MSNHFQSIAKRYQQEKEEIALLRRDGLKWHEVFPISIRQTLFPAYFEREQE
ncbi:hypothetical protein JCM9140_1011 [Halalkalibacter wakoensis JCM 9140]|uniref:Uncharacterized protein n=1 Tax=Halalkalibacter wakoensis JCM 9140 TaxID=1236970 RepID=W4PYY7_9BACI|nr:hypothetical protein [Halalkalibacter wakoensis]GAE25041.1 hypothetical protein JCM9140_1011 [Halalkalibacter wakoensis JCM 9140]